MGVQLCRGIPGCVEKILKILFLTGHMLEINKEFLDSLFVKAKENPRLR